MSTLQSLIKPYNLLARGLDALAPLFDLALRLWVAWAFIKSGLTKIQSWDTTLMLFEYEYNVPLLSPQLAAWSGTIAELSLPVLVALALFLFNAVAVYSYSSFLFSSEGAAGLQQHILWGTMLLVTVFHGPGKLSVDHLLCRKLC